jgi:hypothetical protein
MNARTTLLIALMLSGCADSVAPDQLEVTYGLTFHAGQVNARAHFEVDSRKGSYGIQLADGQTISFAGMPLPMTSDDAPFHFQTEYTTAVTTMGADAAFVLHTPGWPDVSTPARCCVFQQPQVTQTGGQLVVTYVPQPFLTLTLSSADGCVDTLQRDLDGSGSVTLELTSLSGPCNAEVDLDAQGFDSLEGTFRDGTLDYEMRASTAVTLSP